MVIQDFRRVVTMPSMTEVRVQIANALLKARLFNGFSANKLELPASRAVRKLFAPEEMLFAEGEPCSGFYILVRGKVCIFKISSSGREQAKALEKENSGAGRRIILRGSCGMQCS